MKWEERDKNNRLVQQKMIETIKWLKMEQVVKISWFAVILTSGFINLNDGHSGLSADVLWGSFVTHSFLPHGEMNA